MNVAGQHANTLLHDGHAWENYARVALAGVRRALRAAEAECASFLVHASFAFVRSVEQGHRLAEPLGAAADVILECERLALAGAVPVCVVRLGYYTDRIARTCARIARHSSRPAVLVRTAESAAIPPSPGRCRRGPASCSAGAPRRPGLLRHGRPPTPVSEADGRVRAQGWPEHATPFAAFREAAGQGDHPRGAHAADRVTIPPRAPSPRVPRWKPKFGDYRQGFDQVIEAWGE